jgi:MFS family permease
MFASATVPSVGFFLTLLFIPESPRRELEAQQFLSRILGTRATEDEIQSIKSAISEESGNLLDSAFRRPLVVAILIALFSQFTGINTIIHYGSLVFLEHVPNQTASTALWANVIIGAINFIATLVGISLIDRAGRKPMLMSAFGGMALALLGISASIRLSLPSESPHGTWCFCSLRDHLHRCVAVRVAWCSGNQRAHLEDIAMRGRRHPAQRGCKRFEENAMPLTLCIPVVHATPL